MNFFWNDPKQSFFALAASLFCLCILASIISPVIAVFSQWLAMLHKKIFYDKFAAQLSRMGSQLGLLCALAISGGLISYTLENPGFFAGFLRTVLISAFAVAALGFVLFFVYSQLWKACKKHKVLHSSIGAVAALTLLAGAYMLLGLKNAELLPVAIPAPDASQWDIFLQVYGAKANALFYPLLAFLGTVGISTAAIFGLCYLLLRRNKDDFGRDYYNFSLGYCSMWALLGGVLQTIPSVFLLLQAMPLAVLQAEGFANPLFLVWAAGILLPLLACIIWAVTAKSAMPLRHKAGIIGGLVLFIAGVTVQSFMLLHLHNML